MSFVGTRPEAVKYVKKYKAEYMATLLLPAGITSEASIRYKDEAEFSYSNHSRLSPYSYSFPSTANTVLNIVTISPKKENFLIL